MAESSVNYIKHLNKVMELFYDDDRLQPVHIALYLALFRVWNQNRFQNPVQIFREEIMKAAKISSNTTYTKAIRELSDWQYIKYLTSFNPAVGTRIELYSFCNSECKGDCKASVTDSVKVTVNVPYTNITNSKHIETARAQNLEEVLFFFKEEKFPETEAAKFYNHYEANGWLVGKTQMKDWKAAARKWMLINAEFNAHGKDTKPGAGPVAGRLHTGTDKDYSEPL